MRIFLDASVLLAAAGSANGASRAIFDYARTHPWTLVSSPWAVNEVLHNLPDLAIAATGDWLRLRPCLWIVDDVLVFGLQLESKQPFISSLKERGLEID